MKQKKQLLLSIIVGTWLHASNQIKVPLSIGDLIDKITILQVKLEKIDDPQKRENVSYELNLLLEILECHVPNSPRLQELSGALKETNNKLWDIENGTRAKEAKKEFDEEFIKLARSVYITNNHRHALKREINIMTGSRIIEEKQYGTYK